MSHFSMDVDLKKITCENGFTKPTITFPNFEGLVSGDTMFLVCASDILGSIQDEALVEDNCDPEPLVKYREECFSFDDCSRGYNYLAEYNWVVVDKNNNVSTFTIFGAIRDKTPPSIALNWGEGISSGDTIRMECGYAENFDESFVTVRDLCDPSSGCELLNNPIDVFFQERIISQSDCSDYLTMMACSWFATDACGNTSTFDLIVLLTDNTPPEFIDIPDHYCGSQSMTEEEYLEYRKKLDEIEVKDYCSSFDLNFTIDELFDGCDYFIQWEAIDGCGNASYHQQHVCILSSACVGNISGTVKIDENKDAIGDQPVPNVTLFLVEDINSDGKVDGGETVIETTTTDENGFYRFSDVPQGCYIIVELQPNGLSDVKDEDVTNPGNTDQDSNDNLVDNLIPVCITPGEFDDGNDFVEEQFVLSVVLTNFKGTYDEVNDLVSLDWETSAEYNSDYFEVERSVDGETFESIAQVKSKGGESAGANYTYDDYYTLPSENLYYRLVEIDLEGLVTHSDIVAVKAKKSLSSESIVYPNPTIGMITVKANGISNGSASMLNLYDISGNMIRQVSFDTTTTSLNLEEMVSGTYFLSITSAQKTSVHKIVLLN